MSLHVAFLRGINLGRRQMKMAELRAVCEGLGFTAVKTILASGNVRFETGGGGIKERLETALRQHFGYEVGVILRELEAIAVMVASDPFAALDPETDARRFVLFYDQPMDPLPTLTGVPGDYEVARIDRKEIFLVGYRRPNGRYSEGLAELDRQLPPGLATMRSWNTVLRTLP